MNILMKLEHLETEGIFSQKNQNSSCHNMASATNMTYYQL